MVVMAYTSFPTSKTASGELVLRIRGTQRDGQIVRLRAAKCLVGSGPGCDLRLRSRQIAPVHCLILRGPGGTIVRSWSRDTRLNGAAFEDARLSEGDRLSIGPIDFEVIEANAPVVEELVPDDAPLPANSVAQPGLASPQKDDRLCRLERHATQLLAANRGNRQRAQRLIEALRQSRRQTSRLESELSQVLADREKASARHAQHQTSNRGNRLRARRLVEALRQSRQQAGRLESELSRVLADREETSQRHAQQQASLQRALEERGEELGVHRRDLAEKEKAWAEQTARFEARVAELDEAVKQASQCPEIQAAGPKVDDTIASAALEQQKAEVEALTLALHSRQEEMEARDVELQRRKVALDEQSSELQHSQEGLHRQTSEIDLARTRLEDAERELNARESQVAEREAEVRARLAEVEAKAAELDKAHAEIERADENNGTQVRDLEERLARREAALEELRARREADREEFESERQQWLQQSQQQQQRCPVEPVEPHPAIVEHRVAAASRLSETSPARPAQAHAPEEDSIQEYMAQLLQRVRGGSQSEPAAWTEPEREDPQPQYMPAPQQAEAEVSVQTHEEPQDEAPVQIAPRAAAPEKESGLAAMRSLANLSAQNALGTHTRRALTKSCRGRLVLTVLALVSGVFLFEMWSRLHTGNVSLYGAICCLLAAAVWGGHFVVLLVRLAIHHRAQGTIESTGHATAAEPETPLDIFARNISGEQHSAT